MNLVGPENKVSRYLTSSSKTQKPSNLPVVSRENGKAGNYCNLESCRLMLIT